MQSICYCFAVKPTVPQRPSNGRNETLAAQNRSLKLREDHRRPIWNLAHMVNSIKELDLRLGRGANGVEADVTFSKEGEPVRTYHGPPCDCFRHCLQQENFKDYLIYVNEITSGRNPDSVGKYLNMLFLDLKLKDLDFNAKARAGAALARHLRDYLFLYTRSNTKMKDQGYTRASYTCPLRVIISINHVYDVELVQNFVHELEKSKSAFLLERIGFDVGMNDDIQEIETMWRRHGASLNLWQGDGYTNCISPFYKLDRLTKALTKRDQVNGYPSKVYQWTIDLHGRMRESLKLGVDAIMTNHPERLISILGEAETSRYYRLANRFDDPFMKIVGAPDARSESTRYQRSAPYPSSGFMSSVVDVVSSWIAYIREIPMLSLPSTSRFLPKVKRHRQASTAISAKTQEANMRNDNNVSVGTTESSSEMPRSNLNASESVIEDQLLVIAEPSSLPPYEGPKWYTSVVSNILVSMVKLVLPERTDS